MLNTLSSKNSSVDVVLLCKTFLNERILKLVNIPGYNIIANHKMQNKGGGTALLLKEGIIYSRQRDLDVFIDKKVEYVFIEVLTKNGKHMIIGSMYHPPNSNENSFIETILEIKHKLSHEKERKKINTGNGPQL